MKWPFKRNFDESLESRVQINSAWIEALKRDLRAVRDQGREDSGQPKRRKWIALSSHQDAPLLFEAVSVDVDDNGFLRAINGDRGVVMARDVYAYGAFESLVNLQAEAEASVLCWHPNGVELVEAGRFGCGNDVFCGGRGNAEGIHHEGHEGHEAGREGR